MVLTEVDDLAVQMVVLKDLMKAAMLAAWKVWMMVAHWACWKAAQKVEHLVDSKAGMMGLRKVAHSVASMEGKKAGH